MGNIISRNVKGYKENKTSRKLEYVFLTVRKDQGFFKLKIWGNFSEEVAFKWRHKCQVESGGQNIPDTSNNKHKDQKSSKKNSSI